MTKDEKRALLVDLQGTKELRTPGSFLWRRANDEWCTCAHRRSDHEDTLSWGHGDCLVENCECMKFTWTNKGPEKEN